MQRYLQLTLVFFVLAIGIAHAAPARPLYEPVAPPKAPVQVIVDLKGTVWLGKYLTTNRIFVFEADGTVSYRSAAAKAKLKGKATAIKNRGSWKLEGNVLYFSHHITPGNTIMEFRGTIRDANSIVGESTHKAGQKIQQTLQRTTLE